MDEMISTNHKIGCTLQVKLVEMMLYKPFHNLYEHKTYFEMPVEELFLHFCAQEYDQASRTLQLLKN